MKKLKSSLQEKIRYRNSDKQPIDDILLMNYLLIVLTVVQKLELDLDCDNITWQPTKICKIFFINI